MVANSLDLHTTPVDPNNGMIDSEFMHAVRNARNEQLIMGYSASVLIAALGLYEIALDRDRSFEKSDITKYNAWIDDLMHLSGIQVVNSNGTLVVWQNLRLQEGWEIFNELPPLKRSLIASISKTFEFRVSRKDDVKLMTRRHSFSEAEKNQQMDNIMIAMANQENLEYDPMHEKFSPLM